MRSNRATVKTTAINDAFAEGLNEGLRLIGYYAVMFFIGNRRRPTVEVKGAAVAELVNNFVTSLRDEDFAAGVTISILPLDAEVSSQHVGTAQKVAPPAIGDTGVEDAEVVDDIKSD